MNSSVHIMKGTGLFCIGLAENFSHFRTPVQFVTGCGAFQRNSPKGGCANGIPLKILISPFLYPEIRPFSVLMTDSCPDKFSEADIIPIKKNNNLSLIHISEPTRPY